MATAIAVAFLVYSCGGKLSQADLEKLSSLPVQSVTDMVVIQNENGRLVMRMEAGKMERYDRDTVAFESFPSGITVYSYNEDEKLETIITADRAVHDSKQKKDMDIWNAYGNVVVENLINHQVLETDTLFWDSGNERIWTESYVQLYSSDGYMQGYGMVSDQKARNSIIKKPFNSYGYVQKDTTEFAVDTVNFIGPMLKN